MPGLERPDALAPLSASATLRELDTGVPLQAESLDVALPDLPLTSPRFTKNALQFTGLRVLRHLRSVKALALGTLFEPLTAEDYEEVALLPELEELHLKWAALSWDEGSVLPGIRRLRFNKFTGNEGLTAVSALCFQACGRSHSCLLRILRRSRSTLSRSSRASTPRRGRTPSSRPASRACRLDHPGVAGSGTHICRVVVGCQRSALTPSSALQLHAPDPARVGCKAPRLTAGLIQTTGPSPTPPGHPTVTDQ